MSRAASCLVSLMLVPAGFAVLASQSAPISITLPDGSQVQVQGDIIGGVQGGIVGGLTGGTLVGPQGSIATGPQGQGRDTRPTTGNSRIRGRVLVADTGQPARRANVNISAPEVRANRTATTDMDGRFEAVGIHDRRVGRPQDRCVLLLQHGGIGGLAAGIGGEVLIGPELGRVDEDRGDDMVGAAPRFGD